MTLPPYKPPAIQQQRAQVYSIPIFIDTGIGPRGCVASNAIPFPFRITKILYTCLAPVNTAADFYFFVSDNANTPTNAPPPDENILSVLAPQAFVVCPAGVPALQFPATGPTLDMTYEVLQPNRRLKVYVERVAGAGNIFQAIFTIERMS
jgi:hypothetical protein